MMVSNLSHALLRWIIPFSFVTSSVVFTTPLALAGTTGIPTPASSSAIELSLYGAVALGVSLLVSIVRRRRTAGAELGHVPFQDVASFTPLSTPVLPIRVGSTNRPRNSVLHVGKFYPPHMGGIETHLQVLCEGLRDAFDLSAIVSNDGATTVEEKIRGVAVARLAAPLKVLSAPICPSMVHRIRASKAEIVHLHLPNPAAAAAWLASGSRGKLVVTYHSDIIRQKYVAKMLEPILHAVLRRSAAIVVSSPEMIRYSPVLAEYRDKCHVIPFGIPLDQFTKCDPVSVREIRETYGDRLILSAGRLVYYKGFEYLIRAMANVRGKLVIVGKGPLRPQLEELIAQAGVADKVTLLGNVPDLVPYYHASDIFALPSIARSEAFGIVQIEAMAAGIPVVNTNLETGVPYVSLHGQTGLTVPPSDEGALASALNLLLDNQELRESMGRAARQRAYQEFVDTTMIERMTDLYEKVINPGSVGRPEPKQTENTQAAIEVGRARGVSA